VFTFLERNTINPGPYAPIHLASPASPTYSEDTFKVTGGHPSEDTILLLAPLSRDPSFGEEKTKRLGSERMSQSEIPFPFHFP